MKTPSAISILIACVLIAAAGCSSTRGKIDAGPISARTFNFINTEGRPAPEFADQRQQIHALVQNAITQCLARRNISRVEKGGDVTVAYLIITGNNAVTSSIDDYFGYGRDASALLDKAHKKYTNSNNPNYFEAGTLLIDIIDTKTWKVLHRGYATRELLRNPSAEQQTERLNEVVEEILAGVRFQP
jgi:hypothetical protein